MSVNKVTDTARQRIIKKSVDPLPNNPGKVGIRANEVKKAMFGFVTDKEDSLLEELNRVVDEINKSFLEENKKFEDYYTKQETYSAKKIDDKISNVEVDLSNYYTKTETDNVATQILGSAKSYTERKVAELIDSAPETLDTFKEIADAFAESDEVLNALNSAIGNKAEKNSLATTNAKVSALETDNASNKADIKKLQEQIAGSDSGGGTQIIWEVWE